MLHSFLSGLIEGAGILCALLLRDLVASLLGLLLMKAGLRRP